MRNGKTLGVRAKELGFSNPDWDSCVHDIMDEYERTKVRLALAEANRDAYKKCMIDLKDLVLERDDTVQHLKYGLVVPMFIALLILAIALISTSI